MKGSISITLALCLFSFAAHNAVANLSVTGQRMTIENGRTESYSQVNIYDGGGLTVMRENTFLDVSSGNIILGEPSNIVANRLHVLNQGRVSAKNIYMNHSGNAVSVARAGSQLQAQQFYVGSYGESGNTLTIRDGALVKVTDDLGFKVYDGNYLNLSDGFLACRYDQRDIFLQMIDLGRFRYFEGTSNDSYVSLVAGEDYSKYFRLEYFVDDAAAKAFTGYDGLGGYTVLTLVPEPSTYALFIGIAMLGFQIVRHSVLRKSTHKEGRQHC